MALYQALYRAWRPRTFDEVVGQSHITDTLKQQVATDRLSHAYLFTGTRGTGKTSCAKILARAVNCTNRVDGNPCNTCDACAGIENGSILDVVELDAASNNGVDQVRALRDEAVYTPAAVKKRVYIIDEVHMLSTPAFNALLKILEEPPAHLMFILATTELHKVPATIQSRCQQFAFKRILPTEIAQRLMFIAGEEKIDLTREGAQLLARLADGGMRDALSLLDQCAALGGELGETRILETLGLAGTVETARLMEHMAQRDTGLALEDIARLYTGGKDVSAILGELSALARDLLVRAMAPSSGTSLMNGGYDSATLRGLAERLDVARLAHVLDVLQLALARLPQSANRRTEAELTIVRLCDERLESTPQALTARLERAEAQLAAGALQVPAQQNLNSLPQRGVQVEALYTEVAKSADSAPQEAALPVEKKPLIQRDIQAKPLVSDAASEPRVRLNAFDEGFPFDPPEDGELDAPPFDVDEPALYIKPMEAMAVAAPQQTTPQIAEAATPAVERPTPSAPMAATPFATADTELWPALVAGLKDLVSRKAYMFLSKPDVVQGTYESGLLTLWVEEEFTRTAIGDTAVLRAIAELASARVGAPVRLNIQKERYKKPANPADAGHDKLDDLMAFGGQLDSFTVK